VAARQGSVPEPLASVRARILLAGLVALGSCCTALADGTSDPFAPQADPLIAGQLGAQQSMTLGFAAAQIGNVSNHLQRLHQGFDPCAGLDKLGVVHNDAALPRDGLASSNAPVASATVVNPAAAAGSAANRVAPKQCLNERLFNSRDSALWYSGHLDYGSNTASAPQGNYFSSPGLTVGLDHRLADRVIVGAALGQGWNGTVLDSTGSRTRVDSTHGSLYANYRPMGPMTLDALFGYGDASMDNRRWIDTDSAWVRGTRHGSSWYGSLALTAPIQSSALRLEPYLRSDFVQSTLQPYSESGSTPLAMSYSSTYGSNSTVSAGAVGLRDFPLAGHVLTPLIGLKYQRLLNDASLANVYYADSGSAIPYSLSLGNTTSQVVTTRQLGLRYRDSLGLQGEIGANYPVGNAPNQTPVYTASLHAAF